MKNLHILLFSAILVANPTFSQINQTRSILSTHSIEATNVFEAPHLRSVAQADSSVIWCEDFANGLNGNNNSDSSWSTAGADGDLWLHDTDGPNGQFSSNIGPLESTTPNDGWMIFDTGLSNPGQVQAQFVQRQGQLISPYIDLTGEQNVSLRFDHGFRWCCDNDHELLVGVSVNQGQTWTNYQVNENVATNESVIITQTTIIISDIAGGQDSVLIRFDWGGGQQTATNYYWMVDDVTIFETPANASALEDVSVSLPSTLFGSADYINVPLLQAQEIGYFFGGNIINEGVNDLVNARIVGGVTTENFSDQSMNITSLSTSEDSLVFTQNGFIPTATGNYVADVFATDDNNTTTSTTQVGFIVSDFEYARDFSDFSTTGMFGSRIVNDGGGAQIGNTYEIFNSQDLYAIRAYIDMSTDPNAQAVAILNSLDQQGNFIYEDQSEMVNVGELRGQWANFVFSFPYSTTVGQTLLATIQANSTDPMVAVGVSGTGNPGGSYLQDIDGTLQMGDPGTWYTLSDIPMVRLSFDASLATMTGINEEFLSDFSVYPNPNSGVFSLEIETKNSTDILVSVSNVIGQEVYNRQLSNVSQFKDEIDISSLQTGIYVLRLYDNEHVIATEKLIVR